MSIAVARARTARWNGPFFLSLSLERRLPFARKDQSADFYTSTSFGRSDIPMKERSFFGPSSISYLLTCVIHDDSVAFRFPTRRMDRRFSILSPWVKRTHPCSFSACFPGRERRRTYRGSGALSYTCAQSGSQFERVSGLKIVSRGSRVT